MVHTKRTKPELIIIKLGGSVITYKNSPVPKVRLLVIRQLAKQIHQLHKTGYQFILIHGAGSFGHPLAKKYNLTNGFQDENSYLGFWETIVSMKTLNTIITKILQGIGIHTLSLPPHVFITQTNGKLDNFDVSIIQNLLDKNIMPVLYGDPVIDKTLGCSILSGDVIIPYLARKFKTSRIIFLSDVDGIFDDDPRKNPKAKLIPKITNQNFEKVLNGIKSTDRDDVTGEMRGKIISIKDHLQKTEVIIANGFMDQVITRITSGNGTGSMLYFDPPQYHRRHD